MKQLVILRHEHGVLLLASRSSCFESRDLSLAACLGISKLNLDRLKFHVFQSYLPIQVCDLFGPIADFHLLSFESTLASAGLLDPFRKLLLVQELTFQIVDFLLFIGNQLVFLLDAYPELLCEIFVLVSGVCDPELLHQRTYLFFVGLLSLC